MRLPPVQFDSPNHPAPFQIRGVAQGNENERAELFLEHPKGPQVHVIVVIVGDEDHIDRRKVIERNAGIGMTHRTSELNRARPPRINGIGNHVETLGLNEHRRMIYVSGDDLASHHPFDRLRLSDLSLGPYVLLARKHPFDDVETTLLARPNTGPADIGEPLSVKMVGNGTTMAD